MQLKESLKLVFCQTHLSWPNRKKLGNPSLILQVLLLLLFTPMYNIEAKLKAAKLANQISF